VITVKHLSKKFGRSEVLHRVSFSIPAGSAYALIGSNGAGKTTTIRILMNMLDATSGTAELLGIDSRRLSPRELAQIGYVSENQQLPEALSVREYLDYLRPFYPRWDRTLEASILRDLRLPPQRKIGQLSHGMRMKMALACALPFRPRLLVLDEPFSGLDPLVRDEFMEGMLRQLDETTVLISSHELGEIEGVATHIAFMDEGHLLFEESMSDLTARFREVRVTIEGPAPESPALNGNAIAAPLAPRAWLGMQVTGNVISFVDSQFSEEDLGERIGVVAGCVRRIDAQPMALRSIFTTLARSAREAAAGK
jgi:ABC-2 type transport system ATP-binding protein